MTADTDVVDGELVPYDPPAPAVPLTLFGTDPTIARDRMVELADVLMEIVRGKGLVANINGREHLTIEAWTTLGALVGVHAAIVWTRPNETGDGILARAEARTLAGALVGAAEAECSRAERRWKTADSYAIRSMASTRALSRALQAPLRHIAVLAGFEGTAAEEMPADDERARPQGTNYSPGFSPPADSPIPEEIRPTAEQKEQIVTLVRTLTGIDPDTDWKARCVEITGAPWDLTTTTMAAGLIRQLEQALAAAGQSE